MDSVAPIPVILRLAADARDADRVVVTIGVPAGPPDSARSMLLHIAVVMAEGLHTGLACPPELVARLQAADAFQRHYGMALNFLAVRPRSEAEVRARLRRKEVPPEAIDAVLARLRRAGYVDDGAFARYWLGERARCSPRGARLLRVELRAKGVSRALIDEVLAEQAHDAAAEAEAPVLAADSPAALPSAEELPASREEYDALGLARRKLRSYGGLDPVTFRRRMSGFLLRRGYGYDVVTGVLKRLGADRAGDGTAAADDG